ncbi:MAG: hypothetical protein GF411_12850 [Candidatus Lokiarchaeota archaeon]|nr:hypothetical protein [Candidatus Lokiarchaeota archaeon]
MKNILSDFIDFGPVEGSKSIDFKYIGSNMEGLGKIIDPVLIILSVLNLIGLICVVVETGLKSIPAACIISTVGGFIVGIAIKMVGAAVMEKLGLDLDFKITDVFESVGNVIIDIMGEVKAIVDIIAFGIEGYLRFKANHLPLAKWSLSLICIILALITAFGVNDKYVSLAFAIFTMILYTLNVRLYKGLDKDPFEMAGQFGKLTKIVQKGITITGLITTPFIIIGKLIYDWGENLLQIPFLDSINNAKKAMGL